MFIVCSCLFVVCSYLFIVFPICLLFVCTPLFTNELVLPAVMVVFETSVVRRAVETVPANARLLHMF